MEQVYDHTMRRPRGRPPKTYEFGDQGPVMGSTLQRRSRYEEEGRDFACTLCEKSYLSKPGLYLHVKQKHGMAYAAQIGSTVNGGAMQSNMQPLSAEQFEAQRRRGRPRANNEVYGNFQATLKSDPKTDAYLKQEGRAGGPVDPVSGFQEVVSLRFSKQFPDHRQHPLFLALQKFDFAHTPGGPEEVGAPDDLTNNFSLMGPGQRNLLDCNDLFALYLRKVSQSVNEDFYRKLLHFVLMFRDALNKFGWEKRAENELRESQPGQVTDFEQKYKEHVEDYKRKDEASGLSFAETNNCEFAPEISNEFITIYAEQNPIEPLSRTELIEVTQHFCHWMFDKKLTCSKLSMAR